MFKEFGHLFVYAKSFMKILYISQIEYFFLWILLIFSILLYPVLSEREAAKLCLIKTIQFLNPTS